MNLNQKNCEPCKSGAPKLTDEQIIDYLKELPSWRVIAEDEELKLYKQFDFQDFEETMYFVNKVAALAEQNGHHPVMLVEFRTVGIWWWTHKISGLHENDFIMASKTDARLNTFS